MKLIMVLGGLIGFGIGLASALAGGPGGLQAGGLWRAALTALLGGILLRWWGQLWVQCLRDAQKQRQVSPPKRELNSNPAQK